VASRAGSPTRSAERAAAAAIPTGPHHAHPLPPTPRRSVPTKCPTPFRSKSQSPVSRSRALRNNPASSPLVRKGPQAAPALAVEGAGSVGISVRRAMLRIEGRARRGRRAPGSPRIRFTPVGRRAGPAGRHPFGGPPPRAAHRLRRDARSRLAPPDGHDRRWLGSPAVHGGIPLWIGGHAPWARGFASQPCGWFARSASGEARKDTGKSQRGKSRPSDCSAGGR
jgi:hypothetical protein